MNTAAPQLTTSSKQRTTPDVPRIAIIGCGAIAELYHLPALRKNRAVTQRLVLVDNDERRLRELSQQFDIATTTTNYADVLDHLDGAIVATPPATHHPICLELLGRGVSVLCEKPLVSQAKQARELVAVAEANGGVLCVNHPRRLFPTYRRVLQLIQDGTLGPLRSIEYVDGELFTWPAATGFYFQQGARGVLFDRGIHSLDLICWWLGAKPKLLRCQTDSFGGPESLVLMEMQHEECVAKLKLSWLTKLQNCFCIEGEAGKVEGHIGDWRTLQLTRAGGKCEKLKLDAPQIDYGDFGTEMLANFVEVLNGKSAPCVPALEVIRPTELIDEAYSQADSLELPWLFPQESYAR